MLNVKSKLQASNVAQNGVNGGSSVDGAEGETAKARKEAAEWEKKFQVVKQEKDKL